MKRLPYYLAIFAIFAAIGCSESTKMTDDEIKNFGGHQPTQAELQEAMKNRPQGGNPGGK